MARKRMLHKQVWENEELGSLPIEARLLFIGTITLADDDGRLKGNPAYLRSQIFPYDSGIKTKDVRKWRDLLFKKKLIVIYSNGDGTDYIYHSKWTEYQTVRNDLYKPSTFPKPRIDTESLRSRDGSVTKTVRERPSNLTKLNSTKPNLTKLNTLSTKKSPHKQFIEYWYDTVQKTRGIKPRISPADAKNLKRILVGGIDTVKLEQLALYFLADPSFKTFAPSISVLLSGGVLTGLENRMRNEDDFYKKLGEYIGRFFTDRPDFKIETGMTELKTELSKLRDKMTIKK